jgi:hypothetical protein
MHSNVGHDTRSLLSRTAWFVGRAPDRAGSGQESIVAKNLADAYNPKRARRHKVLNRGYSQRRGRAEWFRERRDAMPDDDESGSDCAAFTFREQLGSLL